MILLGAIFVIAVLRLLAPGAETPQGPQDPAAGGSTTTDQARLVVVVVDSLRTDALDNLMPVTRAIADTPQATRRKLRTCRANFTLPCLQTMFEGRESPFVAGLQNFTGRRGGPSSVPGSAASVGRRVALLSDHTLGGLYAEHAVIVVDQEKWKTDHLARDLKLIERGAQILENAEAEVLVLHMTGTDKAAHHQKPGSDGYREHWRAVDDGLRSVYDQLDLSRDALVVAGDHGHTDDGHHDRSSEVIFAGGPLSNLQTRLDLPDELEQLDLPFFMTLGAHTPLPADYEGRFWAPKTPTASFTAFQTMQRTALRAEQDSISASLDARRERRRQEQRDAAWVLAPIAAIAALLAGWLLAFGGRRTQRIDVGLGAAALLVGLVTSSAGSVALSMLVVVGAFGAAGWAYGRLEGGRVLLVALLLVALAAATAAGARGWADFFHTTGGVRPVLPLFFGILLVTGAIAATGLFGDRRRWAEGASIAAVIALPNGVYYYQVGQNFFTGFAVALVISALIGIRKGPGASAAVRTAMFIGVLCVTFLLAQESGGWEWKNYPVLKLGDASAWVHWAALAAIVGPAVALLARPRARLLFAVWVVLSTAFAIGVGGMDVPSWVGAHVVVLAFVAYGRAGADGFPRRFGDRFPLDATATAAMAWIGSLAATWLVSRGFVLRNVDFTFTLELLSWLDKERDVFLLSLPLTALKYASPAVAMALASSAWLNRTQLRRAAIVVGALTMLKIGGLAAQFVFGRGFEAEKLYELAAADMAFVVPVGMMLCCGFLLASVRSEQS